ncbi:Lon protease family protein [Enterovibrio norvegicus]|uniref:AAA family ATPase n=1 Tax=Enterovibrio norvegicus TaxID=188144 RepID=UPI000C854C38|nr:Lon protease family protein [Enterovibrio norvegicus]MCC4796958.1 Lon protease family protein [Enterovibrio norvegicus]PMI26555.1 ATP-dependent protease [Enterovibrio norvegicus]TKF09015.1 Lon protease family protein [Enterovibrio norvegicus]
MQEVTWQSVVPQFSNVEQQIENYSALTAMTPCALQPRLTNSIQRLVHEVHFPRLLLVTAPDVHDYLSIVKDIVANKLPSTDMPVVVAENFDETQLFGAVYPTNEDVTMSRSVEGLLHKANGGVLLISLTGVISQPNIWSRLKHVLCTGNLPWKSAKPDTYCELPNPSELSVRLIVIGDRSLMNDFEDGEPELHGLGIYTEYEPDMLLTPENVDDYLSVLKGFQSSYGVKPLTSGAVKRVMQAGVRFTEDQDRMPLCPLWIQSLLREADYQAKGDSVTEDDVQQAISEKYYRESYLPLRAVDDIHKGQVFIDTRGEHIGQVNGLTVVEMPGHPMAYGEPARISCVVHFGDGDISDVERKVDLAGNIHAKGMMIMQAFVSAALDLDEPLPYAASIVFEQSYCEVDGDSASLAELCAFVSALAQQPINQSIAITGAVDQFGRVQAVGGINEKIEGFYHICENRGLTGSQGVILPKTNLNALCLSNDVATAIREGQFHLWAIEDVEEAFPLITGLRFSGDKEQPEEKLAQEEQEEQEETLLDKIAERIEAFHHGEHRHISLISKLKSWLLH